MYSDEMKCVCGATNLKMVVTALDYDPEKHRGRPRTSHNDENCVFMKTFAKGTLKSQTS
jgi:hypothetical protein